MLAREGGYSNHPADPGGPTMKGVTQRVYDGYRKGKGLATQSAKGITTDELNAIYDHQYWDAVQGDAPDCDWRADGTIRFFEPCIHCGFWNFYR